MMEAKQKGDTMRYKHLQEQFNNVVSDKKRNQTITHGTLTQPMSPKNQLTINKTIENSNANSVRNHASTSRRNPNDSILEGSHEQSLRGSQLQDYQADDLIQLKNEKLQNTSHSLSNNPIEVIQKSFQQKALENKNYLGTEIEEVSNDYSEKPSRSKRKHQRSAMQSSTVSDFEPVSAEQVNYLSNLLKEIKFFKDKGINKQQDLDEIAMNLLLENFDEKEQVFDYGDLGDKFYIILKGSVSIQIPMKVSVDDSELDKRRFHLQELETQLHWTLQKYHNEVEIQKQKKEMMIFDIDKLLKDNIKQKYGMASQKMNVDMDKIAANVADNFVKRGLTIVDVKKMQGESKIDLNIDDLIEEHGLISPKTGKKLEQQKQKEQLEKEEEEKQLLEDKSSVGNRGCIRPNSLEASNILKNVGVFLERSIIQQNLKALKESNKQENGVQQPDSEEIEKKQRKENKAIQDKLHLKLSDFIVSSFQSKGSSQNPLRKSWAASSQQRSKRQSMPTLNSKTSQEAAIEDESDDNSLETLQKRIEKLKESIANQRTKCVENETIYKQVAVFYAGDSFGEFALIDGKRGTRAARIVAIQQCSFGVLSSVDYNKSLAKNQLRQRANMIDFLLGMPQFNSLGRASIQKQLIKMNHMKCCKNQLLVQEGIISDREKDAVYFILNGEFEAFQSFQCQDDGQNSQERSNQQNKNFINNKHIMHIKQQMKLLNSKSCRNAGMTKSNQNTTNCSKDYEKALFNNMKREADAGQQSLNFLDEKEPKEDDPVNYNPQYSNVLKKSLRAEFEDTMGKLTTKTKLTKRKVEKHEVILTRYGPGKVFGHVPYLVKDISNYQPCAIRCSSLIGEVLRISGIDFERILISSTTVRDQFKKSSLDDLLCMNLQKIQKISTIKAVQDMMRIDHSELQEIHPTPFERKLSHKQLSLTSKSPRLDSQEKDEYQNVGTIPTIGSKDQKEGVKLTYDSLIHGDSIEVSKAGSMSHLPSNTAGLSQQQTHRSNQENIQSPQKTVTTNIRKKIADQSLDRRDVMKQIVEGYPDIKKMTTLEMTEYNEELGGLDSSRGRSRVRESTTSVLSKSGRKKLGQGVSNLISSDKVSVQLINNLQAKQIQKSVSSADEDILSTFRKPELNKISQHIACTIKPRTKSNNRHIHVSSSVMDAFSKEKNKDIQKVLKMVTKLSPTSRNAVSPAPIKVGGEILSHLNSPNYTKILGQKERNSTQMINSQEVSRNDLNEVISISNQLLNGDLMHTQDVKIKSLFKNPKLQSESRISKNSKYESEQPPNYLSKKITESQINSYNFVTSDYNQEVVSTVQKTPFGHHEDYEYQFITPEIEPPILYKGGMFGQKLDINMIKRQKRYKVPEIKHFNAMKIEQNSTITQEPHRTEQSKLEKGVMNESTIREEKRKSGMARDENEETRIIVFQEKDLRQNNKSTNEFNSSLVRKVNCGLKTQQKKRSNVLDPESDVNMYSSAVNHQFRGSSLRQNKKNKAKNNYITKYQRSMVHQHEFMKQVNGFCNQNNEIIMPTINPPVSDTMFPGPISMIDLPNKPQPYPQQPVSVMSKYSHNRVESPDKLDQTYDEQQQRRYVAGTAQSQSGGGGVMRGSAMKQHGWFTGYMPGAPIKYGKTSKFTKSSRAYQHLNELLRGGSPDSYQKSPKSYQTMFSSTRYQMKGINPLDIVDQRVSSLQKSDQTQIQQEKTNSYDSKTEEKEKETLDQERTNESETHIFSQKFKPHIVIPTDDNNLGEVKKQPHGTPNPSAYPNISAKHNYRTPGMTTVTGTKKPSSNEGSGSVNLSRNMMLQNQVSHMEKMRNSTNITEHQSQEGEEVIPDYTPYGAQGIVRTPNIVNINGTRNVYTGFLPTQQTQHRRNMPHGQSNAPFIRSKQSQQPSSINSGRINQHNRVTKSSQAVSKPMGAYRERYNQSSDKAHSGIESLAFYNQNQATVNIKSLLQSQKMGRSQGRYIPVAQAHLFRK